MRKFIYFTLLYLSLAACKKDNTLYYGNVTMGNIKGESIISDQGNTFNIVNTDIDLNAFEYGRVIISCDVLRETAENQYDINLTGIASVLTKEPVRSSLITEPESEYNVDNPVIIRELWYSGGYINMLLEFAVKYSSDTKHLINLIYDDSVQEEGKYTFVLRHNAYGEFPTEEDLDYTTSMGYVSFPVSTLIKENSAEITMKWKSHKYENGRFSMTESTEVEQKYNWKREGFEQQTSIRPSLKLMAR